VAVSSGIEYSACQKKFRNSQDSVIEKPLERSYITIAGIGRPKKRFCFCVFRIPLTTMHPLHVLFMRVSEGCVFKSTQDQKRFCFKSIQNTLFKTF